MGLFLGLAPIVVGVFWLPATHAIDAIVPGSVECSLYKIRFEINPDLPTFDQRTDPDNGKKVGMLTTVPQGPHPSGCIADTGTPQPLPPFNPHYTDTYLPLKMHTTVRNPCNFSWVSIGSGDNSQYSYLNIPINISQQQWANEPFSKGIEQNYFSRIHCLLPTHAIIGTNVTNGRSGRFGGNLNNVTVPKTVLRFAVTDESGNLVKAAPVGSPLSLKFGLRLDQIVYNSSLPYSCYFTDGSPNSRIFFVEDSCPAADTISAFRYFKSFTRHRVPTTGTNLHTDEFELAFDSFTFGGGPPGKPSTLSVFCDMRLCRSYEDCLPPPACRDRYNFTSYVSNSYGHEERLAHFDGLVKDLHKEGGSAMHAGQASFQVIA